MKRWFQRIVLILVATALVSFAILEVDLRRTGALDRPLFRGDAAIGYLPLPSQAGRFRNHYPWAFNERSMATSRPFAPDEQARDILLIGDSIVFGDYVDGQTAGPALARVSGATVWPVAAPSWGLANQLTYLEENPDVASAVDDIVFVLNSEDFGPASQWADRYVYARERPWSHAAFALGWHFSIHRGSPIHVKDRGPLGQRLTSLQSRTKARLTFALYPSLAEFAADRPCFALPEGLAATPSICLGRNPAWSAQTYRDELHPRAEAYAVLAQAIAEGMELPIQR